MFLPTPINCFLYDRVTELIAIKLVFVLDLPFTILSTL